MHRKFAKWLAWSSIDGIGRLLVLLLGTVVFSRLLLPREIGLGALVLVVAAVASVFVGAPFEEPLAQRKVLRREHIASVMALTWAIGGALTLASVPVGYLMAWHYGQPEITWLLPVAALSIVLSGQSDVMTGVARRIRRFDAISIATLSGHTAGVAVGILMAVLGYGVWSLIGQRVVTVGVKALLLHERLRLWVMPAWHPDKYRDLDRFARISLFDRLSDPVNHLAFNTVVASLYGLTALGYVNMALRLIEPIRALVAIAAHNIAFSHFAAAQHDDDWLVQRLQSTASLASLFIVPIFAGLAAVMPVMLPIFAGPGWEPAIPIGIFLAIGGALAIPARLVFSALSAKGRPEFSLLANASGVVGTLAVLIGASAFGPVSVGVARAAGDAAQAVVAILVAPSGFAWGRLARLIMLSKAWLLSAAMAAVVAFLLLALPNLPAIAELMFMVAVGVAAYVALLFAFASSQVLSLLKRIRGLPT